MLLPQALREVSKHFARLQGIGNKTAQRYALACTFWEPQDLQDFAHKLAALEHLEKCQRCGMLAEQSGCPLCQDPLRSQSKVLCVVEHIGDCLAIENSGQYLGGYHILGGVLNPLLGIGPHEIGIDRLVERILQEGVEKVIMALNPSVEGDATCAYLLSELPPHIAVERIGFGIPMGGSLEYLDPLTITKGLENAKRM